MWFWDDWFGLAGDDIAENLNDNSGITDWDDEEYDSMPSITLHAGVSTQVPAALFGGRVRLFLQRILLLLLPN